MPVNDNWTCVHECGYCKHTHFVLIDNLELQEFKILCARCGYEHTAVDLSPD